MTQEIGGGGRRPVQDWATDFDHLSPEWAAHAPEITAELRQRCPVAHTDRFYGAYLVTRYDDVIAVAQDTVRFSNRITAVNENRPENIRLEAPPITLDPPAHGPLRRSLLPPFSPRQVARLVPVVEASCDRALDALRGRSDVDGAVDYAQIIPVDVTAQLLGLRREDGDRFRHWVKGILSEGQIDLELAARCTPRGQGLLRRAARGAAPRPTGDLVSWVASAEVDDDGRRSTAARPAGAGRRAVPPAGGRHRHDLVGHRLARCTTCPTTPEHRRRLGAEPALCGQRRGRATCGSSRR